MSNQLGSASPIGPHPTPIVGRAREQALLREALAAALQGQGGMVLVSGEAGIGKTSVVNALIQDAAEQGALVLIGHCYDLTVTPPYGPWRELAAAYQPYDALPLFPSFVHDRAALAAVGSQGALFAQTIDFFVTVTGQRPLVLVLEDLHWADPDSLELLRVLSRQVHHHKLLLLVTYRDDELTRHHPLAQLLPLLVRETQPIRVELQPLHSVDIATLVRHRYRLAGPDEARLLSHVQRQTEGNPFYLMEVLRNLEEMRLLVPGEAGSELGDLDRVPVPRLLRQVIEGRLARLGEDARDVLAIGAVIGAEVPLELWLAVTGTEEATLIEVLEAGRDARLLEDMPGGTAWRFHHALIREALYEGMVSLRRRGWHQRVGDKLEQMNRPDPDAVAYHFKQAGDTRAKEWLLRAGMRAERAYAWRTAAERFEDALSAMAGGEQQAPQRGWLLYRLSLLYRWTDHAKALAYLREAARVADDTGDRLLAAYVEHRLGLQLCNMGDFETGLARWEAGLLVLNALPTEKGVPAYLALPQRSEYGVLTYYLAVAGWHQRARTAAERCFAEYGSGAESINEDALRELAYAHYGLGRIWAMEGQPLTAHEHLQRASEYFGHVNDSPNQLASGMTELLLVVLPYEMEQVGVWQERIDSFDAALDAGREAGVLAPSFRGTPLAWQAHQGDWRAAREAATRSQPNASTANWGQWLGLVIATLAWLQGDQDVTEAQIAAVLPQGPATQPGTSMYYAAIGFHRLAASMALAANDLPAARRWLEAHDRWLAWNESILGQADSLLLWAQVYHLAGDQELAKSHAQQALTVSTTPRQPLALLASHRLLGQFATRAGQHAVAEQYLATALNLSDACAAPFERAQTLLALAELRAAAGKPDDAQTLLDEVRTICESLGAVPMLAGVDALEAQLLAPSSSATPAFPAGLTTREVEVLRLVAEGLTDAEVATHLSLSPRTINTHLTSIYTKLNVSSRSAATRFAVEHHLT